MIAVLIDSAAKGSVVLVAGLVIVTLLRRQSAATRHAVLSVALIFAGLMPALNLVLPPIDVVIPAGTPMPAVESLERGSRSEQIIEFDLETPALAPATDAALKTPMPATPFSLTDAAPWIWLMGVGLCLGFLLVGILRLAWIGSRSDEVEGETWIRAAQRISQDYQLRRPLRLLRSNQKGLLATWGFLKADVILPPKSGDWDEERIEVVLSHELAHVQRSDWLIQTLATSVRALYWFNPLVWIVCRRLYIECEQACDDVVLRRGVSGAEYATHLLELAKFFKWKNREWRPELSMARPSTLERRFRSMLTPGLNRGGVTRFSLAATLGLFVALSPPVAALRAATRGPEPVMKVGATSQVSMVSATSTAAPAGLLTTAIAAMMPQDPPPPAGMAAINGVIVRSDSGAPLAGATVELQVSIAGPKRSPYETTSDVEGRFVFPSITPGNYRIVASTYATGYVATAYGKNAANPAGTPLAVTDGQQLKGVKIAMTPTASITGRVIDRDGEPVPRAQVLALRPAYRDGRKVLQLIQAIPANDLGEYRLFWLPPGHYYLSAKLESPDQRGSTSYVVLPGLEMKYDSGRDPTIIRRPLEGGGIAEDVCVPVYFPGATDIRNARILELRPGDNLGGMHIDISAGRLPSRHIRGTAIDAATGKPAPFIKVNVVPPNPGPIFFVPNAITDANGRFDIAGVAPGQYFLAAKLFFPNPSRAGALNVDRASSPAFVPIEVGGSDLEDIRIIAGPSVSLTGRVVIDGRATIPNDPALEQTRINAVRDPESAAFMDLTQALVTDVTRREPGRIADGSFGMNISPGRYRFNVSGLPPNMYVKSLRLGNTDLLAEPIVITSQPPNPIDAVFGTDAGSAEGTVLDAKRDPAAGAVAVLVPDAPRRGRNDLYKVSNADASGKFRFQSVEPGNYKVFAWQDVEPGIWVDPDFMLPLEGRGRAIQVNANARATVEVTAITR